VCIDKFVIFVTSGIDDGVRANLRNPCFFLGIDAVYLAKKYLQNLDLRRRTLEGNEGNCIVYSQFSELFSIFIFTEPKREGRLE